MKIGLVRHFHVQKPFPEKKLLSKDDVIQWFAEYDHTETLAYKHVDLAGIPWQHCYASPMRRAVSTAQHIYSGPISEITALQELNILHRLPDRIRLPFLLWALLVRIKSHSSNADMDAFRNDICAFLDTMLANNNGNILIVSHWFVMRIMREELIKRNFTGNWSRSIDNGALYVFERA
ncbi:histidine phosphatase family protein [Arsenicibacter rosenii]|uniref:Phosphoglycerate mutase n=1 Tax=Arsenicibacter rosenii TaxID=1750698 RepID=A0A1S2VE57_9BACT|nr:histidine phosphatase family protein [Arsenicibacter rosenii]OIN57041.1 hypothetical protein BLX24_22105 [Arsenicibacter rosenii]